jgi:outer membrane protein assembly factor BamB
MKKHSILLCVVLILTAGLSAVPAAERDWTSWRGPFGNRTTDEQGWNPQALARGTNIRWQTNIGKGHGAVSVRGNRVYTFGNKESEINGKSSDCDIVTCLNSRTGKEIWQYTYVSRPGNWPGPRSTPAINANRVYTHSRHGQVTCLDAQTGQMVWTLDLRDLGYQQPRWGFCSSPVICENKLLLCAGGSGIALDKHTGRKIWSGDTRKADCQSSPILIEQDGQTRVVLMNREDMNIVDLQNGQTLKSFPWGFSRNDPSIVDNRVLLSNTQDGTTLLDISTDPPQPLWQRDNIFGSLQGFVIYQKWAFGFSRSKQRSSLQFGGPLQCIDVERGTIVWEQDLGLWGSMILANDKLIVITGDGRLIVAEASPHGFKTISSAQVYPIDPRELKGPRNCFWSMPVLSHGHIYVRNIRGDVLCVDMR